MPMKTDTEAGKEVNISGRQFPPLCPWKLTNTKEENNE